VDDRQILFAQRFLLGDVNDLGLEQLLGDDGGHECREDDARSEYQLAELLAVQAGLHHDRVHDSDRCRAQRDAADLSGVKPPAECEQAERNAPTNGRTKETTPIEAA